MHYLDFIGWFLFITWIVSATIPRYLMPFLLYPVYDALEELRGGAWGTAGLGTPLSLVIQILISLALAWLLTGWSAWCVLRCLVYTQGMETGRALYFITGFILCEYALARMAQADRYRGFFLSVFHFSMAMGAFIVYSINPAPIGKVYPWLARWMGIDL